MLARGSGTMFFTQSHVRQPLPSQPVICHAIDHVSCHMTCHVACMHGGEDAPTNQITISKPQAAFGCARLTVYHSVSNRVHSSAPTHVRC